MKKTNYLRRFWYSLSAEQRFLIRRLYYFPLDLLDKLSGRTHKYVPPRGFIYTGSPASAADYLKQGQDQLNILRKFISLQPDDQVLDIGSGVGRTAIALTTYLNSNGRYEGFDAVEKGVKWCNSRIKKENANFNFTYIPLKNDLYKRSGISAGEFVFPYPDNSFDKVFLFSVFTHMGIAEIEHYLKEIERVLKPGGRCLSTFFIYDPVIEPYIANRTEFNFPVKKSGYRLMSEKVKSANIAISEAKLSEMIAGANLEATEFIAGFWKDKKKDENKIEYQDIVVLKKQAGV